LWSGRTLLVKKERTIAMYIMQLQKNTKIWKYNKRFQSKLSYTVYGNDLQDLLQKKHFGLRITTLSVSFRT
jgi:hypothetical protein